MVLLLIQSFIQVYGDDSRWVVTKSYLLTLYIVLVILFSEEGGTPV